MKGELDPARRNLYLARFMDRSLQPADKNLVENLVSKQPKDSGLQQSSCLCRHCLIHQAPFLQLEDLEEPSKDPGMQAKGGNLQKEMILSPYTPPTPPPTKFPKEELCNLHPHQRAQMDSGGQCPLRKALWRHANQNKPPSPDPQEVCPGQGQRAVGKKETMSKELSDTQSALGSN